MDVPILPFFVVFASLREILSFEVGLSFENIRSKLKEVQPNLLRSELLLPYPPSPPENGSNKSLISLKYHHLPQFVETARSGNFTPLPDEVARNVSTFVYFIGPIRSSHSIIGSFIDAHEHAVIADEFNFFGQAIRKQGLFTSLEMRNGAVAQAMWEGSWLANQKGGARNLSYKGYDLGLHNLWSGKYNGHIKLVGDKIGHLTLEQYMFRKSLLKEILEKLKRLYKVKTILVMRNPFDNVATLSMYNYIYEKLHKKTTSQIQRYRKHHFCTQRGGVMMKDKIVLKHAARTYKMWMDLTLRFVMDIKPDLHIINISNFIKNPKKHMGELCKFLDLTCDDAFLSAIEAKTYSDQQKTRYNVEWSRNVYKIVDSLIDIYPTFLSNFSFFD